jgi:hypothetical protein
MSEKEQDEAFEHVRQALLLCGDDEAYGALRRLEQLKTVRIVEGLRRIVDRTRFYGGPIPDRPLSVDEGALLSEAARQLLAGSS